ncbi:lasso RiPP family leader peptide-containing protein [Streptomyces sp. C36]|uniref:lasso RiPP family leader peptide-containing protein n=1 Tax=Streptomyces sp. C36 TaxID=3237122 RepID=UPI0034C6D621
MNDRKDSTRITPQNDTARSEIAEQSEPMTYIAPTFTELGAFAELTKGTGTIAVEPMAFGFNG